MSTRRKQSLQNRTAFWSIGVIVVALAMTSCQTPVSDKNGLLQIPLSLDIQRHISQGSSEEEPDKMSLDVYIANVSDMDISLPVDLSDGLIAGPLLQVYLYKDGQAIEDPPFYGIRGAEWLTMKDHGTSEFDRQDLVIAAHGRVFMRSLRLDTRSSNFAVWVTAYIPLHRSSSGGAHNGIFLRSQTLSVSM